MTGKDQFDERYQLDQRVWISAWVRIGISALLSVTSSMAFQESLLAPTPRILFLTTAIILLANGLALVLHRRVVATSFSSILQTFGDLLLSSIAVYLTGGAESAFSVLFHLTVIVAAFCLGARGAWFTAVGALTLFVAISLALQNGLLPSPVDLRVTPTLEPREMMYYLVVNGASLGLVAALAGFLADQERRTGGKLAEAQKTSADLAALNEDIVRSLTVGLAATDKAGELLWLNPAGSSILGHQPDGEDLGLAIKQVFRLDRCSKLAAEQQEEVTFVRGDGEKRSLTFRSAPLLDGEGVAHGDLLIFQDITALKQMQAKVERAERLAALGRLAAGLAHELRNPLGAISGTLQLFQETQEFTDDERRLAGVMLREIDRLADLVTQMLDLARPRSPRPMPVDIASLAREVVDFIRSSAEAEEVTFEFSGPPSLRVLIDPDQARQLIWNLLKNAVQASPPEGTVRVRAHRRAMEAILEVEDSGRGIPQDEREQVFEPFYSTKQAGIGMGLAICRQVVSSHGGKLLVEGAEPHGSIFRVILSGDDGRLAEVEGTGVDDDRSSEI